MRVGFDLDNIFISTPPFIPGQLIERFYKARDNGVLLYRIPTYPETEMRKLLHFPIFRPPIYKNLTFLRGLDKNRNNLYLISSRFKFLEGITRKLVKKYKLDALFDGLYFNFENRQPHEFKNDIIKKLQLDIYVDDDLSLLHYVAKHNQGTKFFWLNHTKQKKPLEKNLFAIENLAEIFSTS